jgi:hypothetical protein
MFNTISISQTEIEKLKVGLRKRSISQTENLLPAMRNGISQYY